MGQNGKIILRQDLDIGEETSGSQQLTTDVQEDDTGLRIDSRSRAVYDNRDASQEERHTPQ